MVHSAEVHRSTQNRLHSFLLPLFFFFAIVSRQNRELATTVLLETESRGPRVGEELRFRLRKNRKRKAIVKLHQQMIALRHHPFDVQGQLELLLTSYRLCILQHFIQRDSGNQLAVNDYSINPLCIADVV